MQAHQVRREADIAGAGMSERRRAMAYGHAERNLALIRQLEDETRQLLSSLPQLDQEQSAWLAEADSSTTQATASLPWTSRLGDRFYS
jgi:hypothetical protein